MEAPGVHRLLDIVTEVENSEQGLGHGRDDLSSTTGSSYSDHPALVINDDCGTHGAHGSLFLPFYSPRRRSGQVHSLVG